jgi:thymidine phosphorylase
MPRRSRVRALGLALLRTGGGRARPGDVIDPRVGLTEVLGVGEAYSKDRPLALLHAASPEQARQAAGAVVAAFDCVQVQETVDPALLVQGYFVP